MTFAGGFNPEVAKGLISIDALLNGIPVKGLPNPKPPGDFGWGKQPVFDSGELGPFENRWQLWKNDQGQYAVAIRGTVGKAGSVIEDLLAVMIPASGSMYGFPYKFARESKAGVHLGFALGAAILLFDGLKGIIPQLMALGKDNDIYITGHSQGAAVATLVSSYLHYTTLVSNNYKTYLFAQPKPGNDHYGFDFDFITANRGLSFRVGNTLDWVPQSPLTLEWLSDLNEPNPVDLIKKGLDKLAMVVETILGDIECGAPSQHKRQQEYLKEVLKNQDVLKGEYEEKKFPPILHSLNYSGCGSPVVLPGDPDQPPPVPGDFMWQHHAGMYALLLDTYFPV
jgi:hypothetical protein